MGGLGARDEEDFQRLQAFVKEPWRFVAARAFKGTSNPQEAPQAEGEFRKAPDEEARGWVGPSEGMPPACTRALRLRAWAHALAPVYLRLSVKCGCPPDVRVIAVLSVIAF